MQMKCALSNLVIEDNEEIYTILLAKGKNETRPITLPMTALATTDKTNFYGEVTITDEFGLEYIKRMAHRGEFNKAFETVVNSNQTADVETFTVRAHEIFMVEDLECANEVEIPILICNIKKDVYDEMITIMASETIDGMSKTYYEYLEEHGNLFFETMEHVRNLRKDFDFKRNLLGNHRWINHFFDKKEEKLKELASTIEPKEKSDEFYAKSVLIFEMQLSSLRDLTERRFDLNINAGLSNFYNNKLIYGDSFESAKRELLEFNIMAVVFQQLGLEFKANSFGLNNPKLMKAICGIITKKL